MGDPNLKGLYIQGVSLEGAPYRELRPPKAGIITPFFIPHFKGRVNLLLGEISFGWAHFNPPGGNIYPLIGGPRILHTVCFLW